jgi:GR25 family glycosyltransferase involved in LPS biosynthesis
LNVLHTRGVDAALLNAVPDFFKYEASRGEAAVTLGHLQVWQEIVNNPLKAALVLEDDVVLTNSSATAWRDEYDGLDIVFLNNRVLPDYQTISSFEFTSEESLLLPVGYGCGADGYLVTRQGAAKLIDLFEVAVAAIDVQIMAYLDSGPCNTDKEIDVRRKRDWKQRLNCRRVYPFVVDHPPVNHSSISNGYVRSFSPGLWLNHPR